jgi:hypothetical protein
LEAFATTKDRGFSLTVLRDAFGVIGSLPRSVFEVTDDVFGEMTGEFASWRLELGQEEYDLP